MKKILFGCIAAASMLFAASCAKESEKALPGEALEVTFDVSLQSALSTRAISDGNTVDKLTYKVYNTAGEAISGKEGTADIANGSASVKISLIQGQTYQFVFWAQKGDTYDLSAFPTVKVNYTNVPNNDESRDAFYFAGDIKIEETTQTVKLSRPFAQINFGVIYDKEVPVTKSYMNVKSGAYSQIDLLTGKVSEEVKNIGFTPAAIPTETLKANGKEYTYLSMDYVLVPKEGSTLDLSFDFDGTLYNNANVPAKMNHRTNLLAEVTAEQEIDFNITVDPNYDEEGDTDIIIEGEGNGEEPGGEEPGETKEVVDVLNNANTINSTATSYTTWTYTATSGAEYSGNSAGQYSSIQLRTTNSNEGVVTTKSGGKVAKISVKWNSNTLDARTLDVYGKNEAYESPADLFNADKQGNLIASFAKADGNKEIVIEGNPTFIGFRSKSSALYLDEVEITWIQGDSSTEPEEPEEPATVTVSNVKAEYADGKVNFTANYDGKKDAIKSAAFVYAPATRAASEGEVAATIGDGVLTASTTLEPGNYTVSVKINGEPVESTTAGQDEVNIEVPEVEEPEQPEEVKAVSVADFNAAPESDTQVYELVGKITGSINTTYGNFDLEDETGSVYVYGLTATNLGYGATNDKSYASLGLSANDKIKIQGYRGSFNDKIEVMYAWFIEVVEKAVVEPVEPGDGNFESDAAFVCSSDDSTNKVYTLGTGSKFNGEAATGFKLGTSSAAGKFVSEAVGVEGDHTLTLYGVAWSGKSGTLKVSVEGNGSVEGTDSYSLVSNSGAANNPPYTITVTESDHYTFNLKGLSADSKIVFESTSSAPRVVVAGVHME